MYEVESDPIRVLGAYCTCIVPAVELHPVRTGLNLIGSVRHTRDTRQAGTRQARRGAQDGRGASGYTSYEVLLGGDSMHDRIEATALTERGIHCC